MRRGRKEEAAQRGIQGASGDGIAVRGEDPGGAVGGVCGSSDDDQQLETGAGEAPSITFGIGFALNDRAALTLSYQQTHVFTAYSNGVAITGSPYSFGTFNFGLGYQISQSTRLNLSVGIGAGPNTPAAKVLFELPYKFSL